MQSFICFGGRAALVGWLVAFLSNAQAREATDVLFYLGDAASQCCDVGRLRLALSAGGRGPRGAGGPGLAAEEGASV